MLKETKKELTAAKFKMSVLDAAIKKHEEELVKLKAEKETLGAKVAELEAKYAEEVEASKIDPNAEVPTEEVDEFLNSLSV